jgi:hypothetical protein
MEKLNAEASDREGIEGNEKDGLANLQELAAIPRLL